VTSQTELVQTLEEALAQGEARLNQVIDAFDALESGVVLYGADDKLVFCNRRFREIYKEVADLLVPGVSYAEIARAYYQRGFEKRTKLDEDAYVRARVEKHLYPDEGDYEFLHGEDRWLLISDRKTASGGVIGFRLDITRRKDAERRLESSELRFRSLLEMSSDWYWEQDDQFRFTYISDGHQRQVGVSKEKRLGRRRWEIGLSGVTEEQWTQHRALLDAHQPFRDFEYRWQSPEGREFHISVSGEPVFDRGNRFVGYRGTGTDITQRKSYEARIKEMAEYDFLTGLPNRSLLNDRFDYAERHARRGEHAMALLFIDLDRFKNINDSLGHHIGDLLLAETAQRLQRLTRSTDTVSRHGGDEFLILLPEVGDPANAGRMAQLILSDLSRPYHIAGHDLIVTPSIGITLWPQDGEDLPALVRKADVAMYHSKSMGRNQYSFFREEMNTRVHERLALENALRRAIERNELFLEYQPIFDLKSRRILSAEALLRWRHPELGLVSPSRFIPIAEDTGLIFDIGEWVIRQACAQKRRLLNSGHAYLPIAINLSALQLRDRSLIDLLPRLMREYGLPYGCIELEITESLLMGDTEVVSNALQALRVEGMKLVIDDFGTGYSNLGFLRRFAVDKLKIDQSFIRDIPADYNAMALARGIVGLAKSIGLRIVAEGVETQSQVDFLLDAGCDEAQGFYLARPDTCDTLVELLDAQSEQEEAAAARRRFVRQLSR
jgi:diguanylate cyclase (GGDEF)-like protein/PAS domain S-box-containing protein